MTTPHTYISLCVNPYKNLAVEQCLLHSVRDDECILFLWRNANTVVIGKNQCSFTQCNVEQLEGDGGFLARRLSGGGAVYHDLGNLNFTFAAGKNAYDLDRQYDVVIAAVKKLGISAERTGRNDLTVDGRKFSGNAFSEYRGSRCHHGTLLIDTDAQKLSRYLLVSADKLSSKGVESVRSRVVNLSELNSDITAERVRDAMLSAFCDFYGAAGVLPETRIDREELKRTTEFFSSPSWLYSERVPCTAQLSGRFSWGGVRIMFTVSGRRLCAVRIYSDALDTDFIGKLSHALENADFSHAGTDRALLALDDEKTEDIRRLIYEKL